jgi:hypothetical protein
MLDYRIIKKDRQYLVIGYRVQSKKGVADEIGCGLSSKDFSQRGLRLGVDNQRLAVGGQVRR